jgi:hypothetical protein
MTLTNNLFMILVFLLGVDDFPGNAPAVHFARGAIDPKCAHSDRLQVGLQRYFDATVDHPECEGSQGYSAELPLPTSGAQIEHHPMHRTGNHAVSDSSTFKLCRLMRAVILHSEKFIIRVTDQDVKTFNTDSLTAPCRQIGAV